MAAIAPFRGLRFNPQVVQDLAPVLCPPYDVLSEADQQRLYHLSPYNVVRLEQALGDSTQKYAASAATLQEWRSQGVLRLDSQPAFYLHRHRFHYQGREWRRRAILARVRLEGREAGTIRPHEGTLAAAKDDRLRLLQACQANISPIFALYEAEDSRLAPLLASIEASPPLAVSSEAAGEAHELWAMAHPQTVAQLQSSFSSLSLYIADGHHRYETALAFQEESCRQLKAATGQEAFNFVLMALVEVTDPGLLILPVHRLVRGIAPENLARLREKLESLFTLEAIPLGADDLPGLERLLETMKTRADASAGLTLGLYGLEPGFFHRLTRREPVPVELMPPHTSPAYRGLEVSLLKHLVMEETLRVGAEAKHLAYTPQAAEALSRVASGEYQLAFFLNLLRVEQLVAVADAGERLPGKSTYFYPKLPTGLVINPLKEDLV